MEVKREREDTDAQFLSVTLFCLVILMKTTSTIRRETDMAIIDHFRISDSTNPEIALSPSVFATVDTAYSGQKDSSTFWLDSKFQIGYKSVNQ